VDRHLARHTADGGQKYTLYGHIQPLLVLNLLYYVEKSLVNAGMPRKSFFFRHRHFGR
jgi:hypothetical protein